MMSLFVRIVLFLFGVLIIANYAWHIFSATEDDWKGAKSDDPRDDRKES